MIQQLDSMNAEAYGVGQQAIHFNRFSAELRKSHQNKTIIFLSQINDLRAIQA